MNAIQYLVQCIEREIPREIILLAFRTPFRIGMIEPSIPHILRDKIIDGYVLQETNLVGGIESIVDLSTSRFQSVQGGMVVQIHPSLTAGREITSILSIGYGYEIFGPEGGPTIASAAAGPVKSTDVRCQLIGPNTIFIEGMSYINCTTLRCLLDNNAGFTNISPRLWPLLADLCVLMTKASAYNTLVISLSTAVVVQGVDMSKVLAVVETYADAITMYKEMLQLKWRKANIMADRVSHDRLIRMQMPH